MLLGPNRRYRYTVSPLIEVICQLRFPAILSIDTREPADFQEAVRATFPRYAVRDEHPAPKITGANTANPRVETQSPVKNYNFTSEDGRWRLNLTRTFLALSTTRYTTWEDFAAHLDRALAAFIEIYRPAFFERTGLRYVNAFSRNAIGMANTPWRELIETPFLGLSASADVDGIRVARDSVDAEMDLEENIRLKLHTGPGQVRRAGEQQQNPETMFIIDADFSSSGNIHLPDVAGRLETMHVYSTRLIRAALTDTLHNALGPEIL